MSLLTKLSWGRDLYISETTNYHQKGKVIANNYMENYICLDMRQKRWSMLRYVSQKFNPYISVKKVLYATQQDRKRNALCWESHIQSAPPTKQQEQNYLSETYSLSI